MSKQVLKDAQTSLRFNKDVLEGMKNEAVKANLSLSDYLAKLFTERNQDDNLARRVKQLEDVVYRQNQLAA